MNARSARSVSRVPSGSMFPNTHPWVIRMSLKRVSATRRVNSSLNAPRPTSSSRISGWRNWVSVSVDTSSGLLIRSPDYLIRKPYKASLRVYHPTEEKSHGQKVVDLTHGERRNVHAPTRHHGREHGAPVDPEGPVGGLHRRAVGDRRLHAVARGDRADRRLAGRPPRPPCGLRGRAGHLLARLAGRRTGPR